MDSYFSLTNVVAVVISFFALLGTIIFLFLNRKSRSNQENKTMASSLSLSSPPSSSLTLSSPPTVLPSHNWKHHVFPSFHGPDVRKGFLSHVLKEFKSKGIDAFVDNDMERSKLIGHELLEAIRGSRIAIVLLSKNYASSTWCLNELVEIMKCREELDQTVMSLFYEVDPTDIKKQIGDFGKVFKKTCKGKTKEDIRRWKHALTEVAQIAGYHSKNWETYAEMIEDIATYVSNKLKNSAPSSDSDGLVGMKSHMSNMGPLLRLDSDEVRKIGILGPSGIGKTTIARFLFHRHSPYFQLRVFMEKIKTIPVCSDDYSVKLDLQKQFMSQLTNETGMKISHLGIVKDRLKDKKVLVVLDDVNRLVQVEAMAKETFWFGPGSRIIIITQDQNLLKTSGIEHIYRVNLPSTDESLQMFCMYAFGHKSPKVGFTELASEVTRLVGRLPLGLRVMGSHFRGMCKEDWRKALPSLKTRLDRDGEIMSILKFSYDALCDEDKRLFLHIACFFKYERVDTVEGCLASCFLDVTQGLRVLAEKSIISIDSEPETIDIISIDSKTETIEMQQLLVQLGRNIVREQSVSDPGKRQFLDDAIDICDVLNDDKAGSSSVLGIYLDPFDEGDEDVTCTNERAFERLSNLQFLRIDSNGINPRSLNSLSGKLRFLRWWEFGMPCFPSSFSPNFLVQVDMRYSKLEKLWEETQPLSNIKWMDLSSSGSLKELPDLSSATNLHDLNLEHCSSLVKLPSSIGNAINLEWLNLSYCSNLVEIPSSIGNAINLKYFYLKCCRSLLKLPFSIGNAVNLQELDVFCCSSLVEIPSSITTITNLKSFDLYGCSSLVELPFNIERVTNTTYIGLSHCSSLVKLPSSIGNAVKLENLNLSHCSSLMELPSSIGKAINLQDLNLSHCSSLVGLPSSIGKAINLQDLNLSHCSSLVGLPSSIGNAINLQKLDLSYCSSLVELPFSIGNAISLEEMNLSHCSNLVELPSSMRNLRKLSKLELEKCSKLEVLLNNINLESLRELSLSDCSLLKSCPESSTDIQNPMPSSMRSWRLLSKSEMCNIQELGPWIWRINCLRRLVLSGMKNLVSLPQLPYSVVELEADNCEPLERLDCSFLNPGIRLNFLNCFKLNQEARDLIIQTRTNEYAVLPGGEVPQCFTYRSSGGSLTVKLNQNPLGTSIKFKACIICAGEDEKGFKNWGKAYVTCSIMSTENAPICYKTIERVFPGNLYTFEVEAEEVTSTELVFEFEIGSSNLNVEIKNCAGWRPKTWEIKECGIFQIMEVPSS